MRGGGFTWSAATPMRDVNGRGMGTAFPRLLMLGDRDKGEPLRLLLSGGRLFTESLIDIELWISSDGMGRRWDQVHSLSYEHNRHVVNPLHKLFHQVNLTDTANSTTSYTSLVPLDSTSALLFYECFMVSETPGVVGGHGHFSMKVTLS